MGNMAKISLKKNIYITFLYQFTHISFIAYYELKNTVRWLMKRAISR